jgi:predicted permease
VDEMRVDVRAMAFALVAVVATTFAFGLTPAFRAAEPSDGDELKAGGRAGGRAHQHRLRAAFIVAEVALAVVLLVGAGLLVRSFVSVVRVERGYQSDHVVGATVFVWKWNPSPALRRQFIARLVERAATLPAVTAAGATTSPPLAGSIGLDTGPYVVVGQTVTPGQAPTAHLTSLTPGAFDVLQMRLRRGRVFTARDDSSSVPVVIVNETMAHRHWPGENPIGQRLKVGYYGAPVEREVVGIVADTRQTSLDAPPLATIYLPHAQAPSGAVWLVLRTANEPTAVARDVKRLVAELNPQLPVASIQSFDDIIHESLKPRRFTLTLFASFSAVALALATIGVYGVISQGITERVREFGVRIALGAQPRDIIRRVMRQGLGAASLGVAIGVLGAVMLTRLLSSMLFAVTPLDLVTFSCVGAFMLGTALAACYIPARRATRVDPLVALRVG